MTLGSLFDGLGTWQLAATNVGIKTLWSSEIDSFCRFVTARHFPDTVQLGDINHITDAPHVDIITASSPCQDLSVAGKRGGLSGERSGLFFKAAELVRQIRPRFFVWENVPGAFSSNGGNDFRTVLEEILQEPVPLPRHWSNAGLVDGRNAQVGWRLLNAEHWGVAQRRKRIFLVADFGGRRAGEILFEPASVSGDSEAGESSQENLAARTRSRLDYTVYDNHWKDSRIKRLGDVAPTVSAMYGTGGNNIPLGAFGIGRDAFNQGRNAKYMPIIKYDLCPPLMARGAAACATQARVRRLTPTECERLQGLPDSFTAGGSDAKRYKALGNGLALPCAEYVLRRITEIIRKEAEQ